MTTAKQQHEITDQYNVQDIPALGAARDVRELTKEEIKIGDDEFTVIGIGDAIIRETAMGKEVRVVLETYEHGFVTWVFDDERYSYYPREHAEEDIQYESYDTSIVENPWDIAH